MDELNIRKRVDLLITILITYFFMICISFRIFDLNNSFENYIMLTITMIIGVVSYYTNITLSLIMTLVCDFLYISFKLYLNLSSSIQVDFNSYYWIVLIPITTILISDLSKNIVRLQKKMKSLEEENSKLIMVDENTGIRNDRALMVELPIYMNISKRHKLPVTLIMVKFKFGSKLQNILGETMYKNLLIEASKLFDQSLRKEDVKYIIDHEKFAFITITDESGAEVVKKRFKDNINKFEFAQNSVYKNINLDIQIGFYTFNESISDPLVFLKLVEKEVEYDIQE